MQRYTVYLYLETTLHVSGGTSNHHQERIQLYLQHLVFVTHDDGWRYHSKHVEQFPDINKLCNVASCWIYSGMYQLPNLHFSLPTKINVVCKPILVHHYFFLITSFFCFCENYYYDTSNDIFNINLRQCNMQGSHKWSVLSRDRSLFNILRTFIKNTEQCFIHY